MSNMIYIHELVIYLDWIIKVISKKNILLDQDALICAENLHYVGLGDHKELCFGLDIILLSYQLLCYCNHAAVLILPF